MKPIFITGIGTGVGKTIVSAIVTQALQADYWKPVQAGFEDGTDALNVMELISNSSTVIHPESYKLEMPASPHIAARQQQIAISLNKIAEDFKALKSSNDYIVIEGAGGLMVPLNEDEFVLDLVLKLKVPVLLVSRNYLGSINHSLLTAAVCRQQGVNVLGWIFNDQYLDYEKEICQWSGLPHIASIPLLQSINRQSIAEQAERLRKALVASLL